MSAMESAKELLAARQALRDRDVSIESSGTWTMPLLTAGRTIRG